MIEIVEENGMWYIYKTSPEGHRYVVGMTTSRESAEAKKRKEEAK